jgi:pimeloyl-ACP methyl ester carboxylesterase
MKEPPLLLIHGYPFNHTMWFSTIASLGANARVIAPDLPGFGKNPVCNEDKPSMSAYADYLARLLDENQQPNAIVAGMSMGGYVALAFAQKYPDRVLGLGLVSSQAAADSPEAKQARNEMIKKIRANGPSVAAEAIVPKMFSEEKGKKPELKQYPVEGAAAAGVEGLCWALEAMAKRQDRTEFLHSLRIPVLIVHGSEDKILPGAKARQLAESCKQPIMVELRGVGHASPLEAPDQVAAALARLVRKVRQKIADDAVAESAEKTAGVST